MGKEEAKKTICTVTFAAMDGLVGANPFWHGFLVLSRMVPEEKKLRVVDTWGFYGLPSTDAKDSWTKWLKVVLGLDVNFIGNHGMFRHEDVRFLERGKGLHGVTFELTEEQFLLLMTACETREKEQAAAIQEGVDYLDLKPKNPAEAAIRIYPYEHRSTLLFEMERIKAQEQGRASRLHPFEFTCSLGLSGPSFAAANTCKSEVLSLLATVLSPEQIARLTENNKHPTIPRYSGPMESIFLHSEGELSTHTKKSGEVAHFRGALGDKVQLYWTLPPQELESTPETKALWAIDPKYIDEVKAIIRQLQEVEWALIDATVPPHAQALQQSLIKDIRDCYEAFAQISPKDDDYSKEVSGLKGLMFFVMSRPRSKEEQSLMAKLGQAKGLLNDIYMAMDIAVDPTSLPEVQEDEESIDSMQVVNYLSEKDKRAICKLMHRTYCDPISFHKSTENEEASSILKLS